MLENAVRICDAAFGNIYRWDGGVFSLAASLNTPTAFAEYRKRSPIGVGPATASGRMARPISTLDNFILQRKVVHVADLTKDQRYIEREPDTVASVELGGVRTVLAAPMLKDSEWVGERDHFGHRPHHGASGHRPPGYLRRFLVFCAAVINGRHARSIGRSLDVC